MQQPTTVVTLSKLITPQAMQQCLQFIYTGNLDKRYQDLQVRFAGRTFLTAGYTRGPFFVNSIFSACTFTLYVQVKSRYKHRTGIGTS